MGQCVSCVAGDMRDATDTNMEEMDSVEHLLDSLSPPNEKDSSNNKDSKKPYYDVDQMFDFGESLGTGVSSDVYRCRRKVASLNNAFGVPMITSQEEFAMKRLCKIEDSNEKCWNREVMILKALDKHPHIIHFEESFEDDTDYYILSELCTGGSLLDTLMKYRQFSEKCVAVLMHVLLQTMASMHAQDIAHRDLKPGNIMFKRPGALPFLKIIDFGTAVLLDEPNNQYNDHVGTPLYMCPKAARQETLNDVETKAWDCWSLGVLAYLLVTGFPPFHAKETDKLAEMIGDFDKLDFTDVGDDLSPECKRFLERLMHRDPYQRCTAIDALRDPWITTFAVPTLPQTQYIAFPALWAGCTAALARPNALLQFIVELYSNRITVYEKLALENMFLSMDTSNCGYLHHSLVRNWITGHNLKLQDRFAASRADHVFQAMLHFSNSQNKIYFNDFVKAQIAALFVNDPISILDIILSNVNYNQSILVKDNTSYYVNVYQLRPFILHQKSNSALNAANILDLLNVNISNGRVQLWDFVSCAMCDTSDDIQLVQRYPQQTTKVSVVTTMTTPNIAKTINSNDTQHIIKHVKDSSIPL